MEWAFGPRHCGEDSVIMKYRFDLVHVITLRYEAIGVWQQTQAQNGEHSLQSRESSRGSDELSSPQLLV